jgi:hypothetical protein
MLLTSNVSISSFRECYSIDFFKLAFPLSGNMVLPAATCDETQHRVVCSSAIIALHLYALQNYSVERLWLYFVFVGSCVRILTRTPALTTLLWLFVSSSLTVVI